MRIETMTVEEVYDKVNSGEIKSDIDVQREIVYDTQKQQLVIDSLANGIPLPAFYFWENDSHDFETLDGKQRIHAITRFMQNDIEYNGRLWMQTDNDLQHVIRSTELCCIICSGEDDLKREIFYRINTLGVALSTFEVLNGLFHGEYLRGLTHYVHDDKNAIQTLGDSTRGKRQVKALKYILALNDQKTDKESLNTYVATHKDEPFSADQHKVDKYLEFCAAIFDDMSLMDIYFDFARSNLKNKSLYVQNKSEINSRIKTYKKSVDWKLSKHKALDIANIIDAVVGGVTLDSRRFFTQEQKEMKLAEQNSDDGKYRCALCGQKFFADELVMDHIKPWCKGGRTELSNAQLLCRTCNTDKGSADL